MCECMCVWLISAVVQRQLFIVMLPNLLSCGTVSSHLYSTHTHACAHTHIQELEKLLHVLLCFVHAHTQRVMWKHTFILYLEPYVLTQKYFHEHTFQRTHTNSLALSLSSTPDFVPVTLGGHCQWLLLRFLRRGLEGGWRKPWPGITQLSSLYPSVHLADEWEKSFPPSADRWLWSFGGLMRTSFIMRFLFGFQLHQQHHLFSNSA